MSWAKNIYKKDWFFVLLVGLMLLGASLSNTPALTRLDALIYDAGVRMTSRAPGASDKLALVAIDEASIQETGRWPWPRSVLAEAVHQISRGKPRAIGLLVPLDEPQPDLGLSFIRSLSSYLAANPLPKSLKQGAGLSRLLRDAEHQLDSDARLAQTIPTRGNVILPMYLELGAVDGESAALPDYVRRHRLARAKPVSEQAPTAPTIVAAQLPLERFARGAAGIGHVDLNNDPKTSARDPHLVVRHGDEYYPSAALLLAAHGRAVRTSAIRVTDHGVRVGQLDIATDEAMRVRPGFYSPREDEQPFTTYSFKDVRSGQVPVARFTNKIVLLGPTATGIDFAHDSPVGQISNLLATANTVVSILNQDFYQRPTWLPWAEGGLFCLVLLYLLYVLPHLSTNFSLPASLAFLLALVVSGHYLLISEKLWLKTALPMSFLLLGHGMWSARQIWRSGRHGMQVAKDSAQTMRMLGLAFQGQGQLDMALDKFRKLPVDASVLDLFFNLALDFERKRQFNKAVTCYDHILAHDAKFRDVAKRKQRAAAVEETVVLGSTSASSTLILNASEKPRLGRYEVEKELGRGAMGTVYLGRDPRINRVVAIKTVALSQFDDAALPEVRERFFREAETAGRLSHPNIVTIYDAGEEHDLGYIAMEYLEGKDLSQYIEGKKKRLPIDWVVDVVGQVAGALSYAHKQGVVHRDVKPANIMVVDQSQKVKVTDFGIARVTASARTTTGTIVGSPFYMSPEQLAGKRVDGRSDIFSLGVTLFELLTGKTPFNGDSMASLMYQIANEPHPDILDLRRDVTPRLRSIINKALQKDPVRRFQTAAEFQDALRKVKVTA